MFSFINGYPIDSPSTQEMIEIETKLFVSYSNVIKKILNLMIEELDENITN